MRKMDACVVVLPTADCCCCCCFVLACTCERRGVYMVCSHKRHCQRHSFLCQTCASGRIMIAKLSRWVHQVTDSFLARAANA